MRLFFLSALSGLLVAPFASAQDQHPVSAQEILDRLDRLGGHSERIYAGCCKTCRKGKACGDSCISRAYQCHKGQGCACDG